jgi:hypothetical protein
LTCLRAWRLRKRTLVSGTILANGRAVSRRPTDTLPKGTRMRQHWYFDDFVPGQEIALGSCTVTEEEIIAFATRFDPQP